MNRVDTADVVVADMLEATSGYTTVTGAERFQIAFAAFNLAVYCPTTTAYRETKTSIAHALECSEPTMVMDMQAMLSQWLVKTGSYWARYLLGEIGTFESASRDA